MQQLVLLKASVLQHDKHLLHSLLSAMRPEIIEVWRAAEATFTHSFFAYLKGTYPCRGSDFHYK